MTMTKMTHGARCARVLPAAIVLMDDSVIGGKRRSVHYWITQRAFAPGRPTRHCRVKVIHRAFCRAVAEASVLGPAHARVLTRRVHAQDGLICSPQKDEAIGLIKNWSEGDAFGFLFYMFVVPMSWIPALTTLLFTGVGYSVTAMVVASRSRPMAMGSTPVAVASPRQMPAE